jgi:hypothetical protein
VRKRTKIKAVTDQKEQGVKLKIKIAKPKNNRQCKNKTSKQAEATSRQHK